MLVESEKVVKVTLRMTEREAHWLKNDMQNPKLNEGEYEDADSRNMRENFFCTLREELGN